MTPRTGNDRSGGVGDGVADLESPGAAEDLYRYRSPDVPRSRPVMQGDVFEEIEIPGLDDGLGLAVVMTHACSMRQGANLRPRLLMGRVATRQQPIALPWKGHFAVLPLPDLRTDKPEDNYILSFDELGTVATATLDLAARIACLDDFGIALLNQRHAHYFTRYAVETAVLHEQSANVLVEAELLEDWIEAAVPDDAEDWDARASVYTAEFDQFVGPHRGDLKKPSRRAAVRRIVNEEIRRRFG